jgi:hypothetical protein
MRIAGQGTRLWIAAEAGQLYRSDDGGASWRDAAVALRRLVLRPAAVVDGDALLAFGLRGNLFRSDDAGQSWRALEPAATAMLTDGCALGAGSYALVGLSGTVLLSGDGGASWTLRSSPIAAACRPCSRSDGALLAVGEGGARRVTARWQRDAVSDRSASPRAWSASSSGDTARC